METPSSNGQASQPRKVARLIEIAAREAREEFATQSKLGRAKPLQCAGSPRVIRALELLGFDTRSDCEETVQAACAFNGAFRDTWESLYFKGR